MAFVVVVVVSPKLEIIRYTFVQEDHLAPGTWESVISIASQFNFFFFVKSMGSEASQVCEDTGIYNWP